MMQTEEKIRVAIVGASGYTGVELLRILKLHPTVEVTVVTSRQNQGTRVVELFPSLHGYYDLKFQAPDMDEICAEADVVFTAVPHQTAISSTGLY
jgi:N-acetyl-gamma-glutamyl-phosphate reductase